MNEMGKMDIINIVLGITNVIILIISIVFASKAIKSNERIAEKSGSYDKGEINVSFGGFFIKPNQIYDVYYGFDNISDSVLNLTNYPLGLHSYGKKTVENISAHFKYPHLMNMAIEDSLLEQTNKNFMKLERCFQTIEPYDQVLYKINSIDPGVSLGIGDIFVVVMETERQMNVDAKTADDYDVSVLIKYDFRLKTEFILTGKDIDALYYDFRLQFLKTASIEELIKKIAPKEKKSIMTKEKDSNYFFVVIPTINETKKTDLGEINMSHSKGENTVLCVFEENFKKISVKNQVGKEISRIDID